MLFVAENAIYDAVVMHSLSRFFCDLLEFGLYERRLNKAGVKLISITQQTSDDPSGEMARKIFSIFDEYQSKENSKHTLRAMKEIPGRAISMIRVLPLTIKPLKSKPSASKGRKRNDLPLMNRKQPWLAKSLICI